MNIHTYLISCKGCEDRRRETESHLQENRIHYKNFRGLNGEIAGIATRNPYTADDPSGKYFIRPGMVALGLNHWFLWNEALRRDHDMVMVMEDDVRVIEGFAEKLYSVLHIMEATVPHWDFLYVGHFEGGDGGHKRTDYRRNYGSFAECGFNPYGTHCYIAKDRALRVLVETNEKQYANIDIQVWNESRNLLNFFALTPSLAHQKREGIYATTKL